MVFYGYSGFCLLGLALFFAMRYAIDTILIRHFQRYDISNDSDLIRINLATSASEIFAER